MLQVELPADPMALFEEYKKTMISQENTMHKKLGATQRSTDATPSSASHGHTGRANPFGSDPSDLRDQDLTAEKVRRDILVPFGF